jgi:hypothetical protein
MDLLLKLFPESRILNWFVLIKVWYITKKYTYFCKEESRNKF